MAKTKHDAKTIIERQPIAALITINEDGFPIERTMYTATVASDFTVDFASARDTNKCKQVSKNPGVAAVWPTADGYLSLTGEAAVLDDMASREEAWRPDFIRYFPGGVSDPNYVVIKITPRTISYYELGAMDAEKIDVS